MADTSHVLARKYRPQVFADLIGQEALVRTVSNAIAANRLPHAYMLTGIRGVGKTSSARIIAKGLNCIGPDGKGGMTPNPCGKCQHCINIANDSHMDVIEIDAASNTGVDNVREIIEGAKYNPVSARFKIYIIDEVHMLSKAAFNALLKTLEEPPERIKFIFATTEIRKVPITILSRCQRFDLRRLDEARLAEHLGMIAGKEKVSFEPDALTLLARAGDGSVRDSLSLMDQAITQLDGNLTLSGVRGMLGLADRTALFDMYEALMKGDTQTALGLLDTQYDCGADPFELAHDLLDLTHWLTRIKLIPSAADDIAVPTNERTRGKDLSGRLSMGTLTMAWQLLLKGLGEIRMADSPIKALEMVLIRLAFATEMPTPANLIAEIKKKGTVSPDTVSAAVQHPVPRVPMSPVGDTAESATPAPASASGPTQAPTPGPVPTDDWSLTKIVALARKQGERLLAYQVEAGVRPVSVRGGLIQCVFTPEASRDLCARLTAFLSRETGINWVVQTQVSGGGSTLQEEKQARQNALLAELKQTPAVHAVLTAFPGAKIEKIRPIKTPQEFTTDDAPVENNTDLDE